MTDIPVQEGDTVSLIQRKRRFRSATPTTVNEPEAYPNGKQWEETETEYEVAAIEDHGDCPLENAGLFTADKTGVWITLREVDDDNEMRWTAETFMEYLSADSSVRSTDELFEHETNLRMC